MLKDLKRWVTQDAHFKFALPVCVIFGLASGTTAQFVWKLSYYSEPLWDIYFEIAFIWGLVGISIWALIKLWVHPNR
jgi:hypothetical protein